MNIAFVVFSLRGGGAERVVSQLANSIVARSKVSIIQLSDIDPFYSLNEDIDLIRNRGTVSGPLRYASLSKYLFTILKEIKPDIVIAFGETISPFVIAIARIARVPVVVSNRASPLSSLRGRRGWLNPLVFRFAVAVLVPTKRAVEILSPRFRGCRWIVMENPVDVPATVPGDQFRENLCVSVGYLGDEKNQTAVIHAFAESAPPEWSLAIVGDGPNRVALEDLVRQLGMARRVKFTGAVDDVYSILLTARVFAFASRSEGFPNALAEAMACGCACIAYDCVTGPGELISHEKSGLLIPLDDQKAFSSGLKRLMTSSALRARLVVRARARTQALDKEHIASRFLDAVDGLRKRA